MCYVCVCMCLCVVCDAVHMIRFKKIDSTLTGWKEKVEGSGS